jgi:hypothetical protein
MNGNSVNRQPKMSVVVLAADGFAGIRRTMRHLEAQTARDDLEIVYVTGSAQCLLNAPDELNRMNHRIVEVPAMESTPVARAAGVRRASAPIVAFAEDHSFPEPRWAELLIQAHQNSWAGVGPAMCNGNPSSSLSWINLAIEYGPWLDPLPATEVEHLPGHNSSYRREILLTYGPELEAMLEAESVLHWDLRRRGYRLYLETGARTAHFNYSRFGYTIRLRFFGGRQFAAARARRWSILRRLSYGIASPLIPLVRFKRILSDVRRAGPSLWRRPQMLPMLILILMVDGAGEFCGYVFGSGRSNEVLTDLEFSRDRFMNPIDARAYAAADGSVG